MENFEREILQYSHINKLFDYIRLIDIQNKSLYAEYQINSSLKPIPVFNFQSRQELYHQCTIADTVIYQVNQEGQMLILLTVLPIYINKRKFILECAANVTGRIDVNNILSQNTLLLRNAYKLSITDELTGLYNRRYINQMLPFEISTCIKQNIPLSVIFTDLDRFKQANDLYGHIVGDHLLCEFASELQRNIRKGEDWVARYGGDEFLLCLVGIDNKRAKMVAERIRKTIERKVFEYHEYKITMTCSFGIYTVDDFKNLPSYNFILKTIDERLYMAKKAGGNMVI